MTDVFLGPVQSGDSDVQMNVPGPGPGPSPVPEPSSPPAFLSSWGGSGGGVGGGVPDARPRERERRPTRRGIDVVVVRPSSRRSVWALPVAAAVVGGVVALLREAPEPDDVALRENPSPFPRVPRETPAPKRRSLSRLPVARGDSNTRACLVCGVFYPVLSFEVPQGRPRSKICTKCLDEGAMRVYSRECVECGAQFESPSSRAIVCEDCKPARDARFAAARQRKHRNK